MAQVIEGTWEEIKSHEAELAGHRYRLTRLPEPAKRSGAKSEPASSAPKILHGYGAFKGLTGGTEELARAKQEEIELEDQKLEARS